MEVGRSLHTRRRRSLGAAPFEHLVTLLTVALTGLLALGALGHGFGTSIVHGADAARAAHAAHAPASPGASLALVSAQAGLASGAADAAARASELGAAATRATRLHSTATELPFEVVSHLPARGSETWLRYMGELERALAPGGSGYATLDTSRFVPESVGAPLVTRYEGTTALDVPQEAAFNFQLTPADHAGSFALRAWVGQLLRDAFARAFTPVKGLSDLRVSTEPAHAGFWHRDGGRLAALFAAEGAGTLYAPRATEVLENGRIGEREPVRQARARDLLVFTGAGHRRLGVRPFREARPLIHRTPGTSRPRALFVFRFDDAPLEAPKATSTEAWSPLLH